MKVFILMQYDELRGVFLSFDKALDRLCSAEYNEMKWNPHYPFLKEDFFLKYGVGTDIPYEDFKEWVIHTYREGGFEDWDIFEVSRGRGELLEKVLWVVSYYDKELEKAYTIGAFNTWREAREAVAKLYPFPLDRAEKRGYICYDQVPFGSIDTCRL